MCPAAGLWYTVGEEIRSSIHSSAITQTTVCVRQPPYHHGHLPTALAFYFFSSFFAPRHSCRNNRVGFAGHDRSLSQGSRRTLRAWLGHWNENVSYTHKTDGRTDGRTSCLSADKTFNMQIEPQLKSGLFLEPFSRVWWDQLKTDREIWIEFWMFDSVAYISVRVLGVVICRLLETFTRG